jgi:periplasmic copper chaperone A
MRHFILILSLASSPAFADVKIETPWARPTPPGARVAAGYLTIRNQASSPERLVGISSPAAAQVQTHVTVKEGEVVRMREVKGYEIPANGTLELKPGGAHLMFVNIRQPFKEGDRIPVVLKFESAGEVRAELPVGRPETSKHPGH